MNIINELMIRNRGNGKGFAFSYKGQKHTASTITDLIESISGLPQVSFEKWYQEILSEIQKDPMYSNEKAPELLKKQLFKILDASLSEKRDYRDKFQKDTLPSAFNAEIIACKFKPAADYNNCDKELLEIFAYCEDNEAIYASIDGNYTLIGTALDISNRKSNASYLAGSLLKKYLDRKYCNDYQLWGNLYHIADDATDKFFEIRRSIEDAINQNILPSQMNVTVNDKPMTIKDLLSLPVDKFPDDWDDALHTAICKEIINNAMPSIMFNSDIAQLCFESKNGAFHRYSIRPAHGKKANLNTVIALMFEDPSVIDIIRHIKKIPHVISDGDSVLSEFKLKNDWKDKLPEQYKSAKECKALKSFLSPFSENERKVMMAWAYMALHPITTGESIGLLIQTGGGTFKTNYFAEMTRYLMSVMYNAPKDRIGFLLKKNRWVSNPKLMEPGTRGISKAGMVIIDEAGKESLEQYKLWSGSTAEVGIDYDYSKVYQEGVQTKIYCPWLFTSNEDIALGDDKGVYDRRLIVIKRMDLSNFKKPYEMKDFQVNILKEASYFYDLAKKNYSELKEKYGSLTAAVNEIEEIHKNLSSIFDEEGKLAAYEHLYNQLHSDPFEDHVEIRVNEFNGKIEEISKEFDINPKGFVKYIFSMGITTQMNEKGKFVSKNGQKYRVHMLYPLK